MTHWQPGRRTVAGRNGLPYTDAVDLRLPATLLSVLVLTTNAVYAQSGRHLVTLETEDAYIYMDEGGVAIRAEKNWACRNVGWASTADPKIMDNARFRAFRDSQITNATWDQWICTTAPGPVTFSREVQKAQQEMNASPKRPAQARRIPETGRYNWEMLDYSRLVLSSEVGDARRVYAEQVIAAFLDFLPAEVAATRIERESDAVIAELSEEGKAKSLNINDPICGRVVANVYDAVTCRMHERETRLRAAAESYRAYADMVIGLNGRATISTEEAQAANLAARQVKRRLAQFEVASLGLMGSEAPPSE